MANGNDVFPAEEKLVTKTLSEIGYDCGLVGKLHLAAAFERRRLPDGTSGPVPRTEVRTDDGYRVFHSNHDPLNVWNATYGSCEWTWSIPIRKSASWKTRVLCLAQCLGYREIDKPRAVECYRGILLLVELQGCEVFAAVERELPIPARRPRDPHQIVDVPGRYTACEPVAVLIENRAHITYSGNLIPPRAQESLQGYLHDFLRLTDYIPGRNLVPPV